MRVSGFNIVLCPYCSQEYKEKIIASYNTFNSRFYSDGHFEGDYIPKKPGIIKCINSSCGKFFKIREGKVVAKVNYDTDGIKNPEWDSAFNLSIYEISVDDLYEALTTEFCKDVENEKKIRVLLLRKYNDIIRNDRNPIFQPAVENLFVQNTERLIEISSSETIAEKLFLAELYREKKDFDSCIRILKTLKSENENERSFKEKIFSQAMVKDDKVFNTILVAIKIEFKCEYCGDSHILFDLSKLMYNPYDSKHYICQSEKRIFDTPTKIYGGHDKYKNIFIPVDDPACPSCGKNELKPFIPEEQNCIKCQKGKYKIVDWYN